MLQIQNIHMGSLDSAADLHRQITRVVGSSDYRAILSGQELYFRGEPQKTLGEIGFSGSAVLMVQKRPAESGQAAEPVLKGVPNSVEAKILEHFDELYEMLDSRDHQGQLVSKAENLTTIAGTHFKAHCFRSTTYFANSHRNPELKTYWYQKMYHQKIYFH